MTTLASCPLRRKRDHVRAAWWKSLRAFFHENKDEYTCNLGSEDPTVRSIRHLREWIFLRSKLWMSKNCTKRSMELDYGILLKFIWNFSTNGIIRSVCYQDSAECLNIKLFWCQGSMKCMIKNVDVHNQESMTSRGPRFHICKICIWMNTSESFLTRKHKRSWQNHSSSLEIMVRRERRYVTRRVRSQW